MKCNVTHCCDVGRSEHGRRLKRHEDVNADEGVAQQDEPAGVEGAHASIRVVETVSEQHVTLAVHAAGGAASVGLLALRQRVSLLVKKNPIAQHKYTVSVSAMLA